MFCVNALCRWWLCNCYVRAIPYLLCVIRFDDFNFDLFFPFRFVARSRTLARLICPFCHFAASAGCFGFECVCLVCFRRESWSVRARAMWIDTFVFHGAFGICAFQFNFFFVLYDFILFVFPSVCFALCFFCCCRSRCHFFSVFLFWFGLDKNSNVWLCMRMYNSVVYLCSRYAISAFRFEKETKRFNAHIIYTHWACVFFSLSLLVMLFLLFYFSFAFNSLSAWFGLVSFLSIFLVLYMLL